MQNKRSMNIHAMFYIVIVSATLKVFVRFLPTTNERLVLAEVLMGGSFPKRLHKCLWETDAKCSPSRDDDEMLAVREQGRSQVTSLIPRREAVASVFQNRL